jgi:hypothetical protein
MMPTASREGATDLARHPRSGGHGALAGCGAAEGAELDGPPPSQESGLVPTVLYRIAKLKPEVKRVAEFASASAWKDNLHPGSAIATES